MERLKWDAHIHTIGLHSNWVTYGYTMEDLLLLLDSRSSLTRTFVLLDDGIGLCVSVSLAGSGMVWTDPL